MVPDFNKPQVRHHREGKAPREADARLLTPGNGLAAITETAVAQSPSSPQSKASPEKDLMAAETKGLHVEKKRGFPRPRLNQQEFCLKSYLLELGLRRGKVETKGLGDEGERCPLRRLKFPTTSLLFGRDKEFALISLP